MLDTVPCRDDSALDASEGSKTRQYAFSRYDNSAVGGGRLRVRAGRRSAGAAGADVRHDGRDPVRPARRGVPASREKADAAGFRAPGNETGRDDLDHGAQHSSETL